ncbi:MAG: hypothetical protein HYT61_01020 [Candidatus Yanofskybacteria bacterium]|nr:hypothetical protein [Candidatus Yanofskybacteria bacterium]
MDPVRGLARDIVASPKDLGGATSNGMDSIFAKLFLSFASILGVISAPSYIQLSTASVVFDYQTGDGRPLYYFNLKNIGSQKERFDVSVNVPWIFISREGYDNVTSLYLESEGAVNFTLDVRPEMVSDGSYIAEISIKAVDVYDYSVIETKTINVTFNKNFVATPVPSETVTPALSVTPALLVSPVVSLTPTTVPALSSSPLFSPTPKLSPSETSPKISPISTTSPPIQLRSAVTPVPSPSASLQPKTSRAILPFISFWQFLRNLIF